MNSLRDAWRTFWTWDGSAIPWFSIPPLAVLIVLVLALLVGCSILPAEIQAHEERHCEGWSHTGAAPDYVWAKTRAASERPWFYVRAIDPDSACRSLGAVERGQIGGCALWQPVGCIIVLPESP